MYFTPERKKYALEDIAYCYECAKIAGIDEHLFVGFGLVLGIVRNQDFIPNDDDVDMCLRRDRITPEQELHYVNLLARDSEYPYEVTGDRVRTLGSVGRENEVSSDGSTGFLHLKAIPQCGMFRQRKRCTVRSDDNRLTWFTLRRGQGRAKFCHWLGFDWNGYWWHSKGGMWVTTKKFDIRKWGYQPTDEAIMKGIPSEMIGETMAVDFHGVTLRVPQNYGMCLDFWYPGWRRPGRGASAKTVVAIVPKWSEPSKWRIKL